MGNNLLLAMVLAVCIPAVICIWRKEPGCTRLTHAPRQSKMAAVFWLSTSLTMIYLVGYQA